MKTQILQLEPHDDVISTRDKMGWGQTRRIVLVWPKRSQILTRRLDLVLLERHAASIGSQLALVTTDPRIRFNAQGLRLLVFKSIRQAQSDVWRVSRRRTRSLLRTAPRPDLAALREQLRPQPLPWLEKPLVRYSFFSLGILGLIAILSVFLPGAQVTLTPKTSLQQLTLPVTASQTTNNNPLPDSLPTRLESVVVEGRDTISTTGSVYIPENFATGSVLFTNLISQSISIPIGTIVTTLPSASNETVRFMTTIASQVAAGPGKTKTIPVQAVLPGPSGNLPSNTLQAIAGPLGLNLNVTNYLPTSNGTERLAPAPSSADYDLLYKRLYSTLQQTASAEFHSIPTPESLPITSTIVLSSTLERTYSPSVTSANRAPASFNLSLTLRLAFKGLVISGSDINTYAKNAMEARLPAGFSPLPDGLKVIHLTYPALTGSTANWKMQVSRQIRANFKADQVEAIVNGKFTSAAKQALSSQLPLESPPTITMTPAWWPRLPILPMRISVLIKP